MVINWNKVMHCIEVWGQFTALIPLIKSMVFYAKFTDLILN
jgi:hypothetical protein